MKKMNAGNIMRKRVKIIIYALLLIVVIGAWLNWSDKTINTITGWGASILISVILSGFCGALLEKVSGDFLKKISIPISIGKYTFSVSLFVIATFVLKFVLFR